MSCELGYAILVTKDHLLLTEREDLVFFHVDAQIGGCPQKTTRVIP